MLRTPSDILPIAFMQQLSWQATRLRYTMENGGIDFSFKTHVLIFNLATISLTLISRLNMRCLSMTSCSMFIDVFVLTETIPQNAYYNGRLAFRSEFSISSVGFLQLLLTEIGNVNCLTDCWPK